MENVSNRCSSSGASAEEKAHVDSSASRQGMSVENRKDSPEAGTDAKALQRKDTIKALREQEVPSEQAVGAGGKSPCHSVKELNFVRYAL